MSLKNPRKTKNQRRQLRQNMTEAEVILWEKLRRKNLGVRVKRQYGIGPYILDFYIPMLNLAIEVDGKIHLNTEVKEKDVNKDAFLERNGIDVVRFKNEDVLNDIDRILEKLRKKIEGNLN